MSFILLYLCWSRPPMPSDKNKMQYMGEICGRCSKFEVTWPSVNWFQSCKWLVKRMNFLHYFAWSTIYKHYEILAPKVNVTVTVVLWVENCKITLVTRKKVVSPGFGVNDTLIWSMTVATCTIQKLPKIRRFHWRILRKCVMTSAYFQLDSWKKVVSGSRAPVTACIYNCDVPMAVVEERRNL